MNNALETIRIETVGRVGVIHLTRARKLNAINGQMMQEATEALRIFSSDRCDCLSRRRARFQCGF